MLDVFAHPDLSHELVLVSVHSSQLTNMGEDVLQAISKLKIYPTSKSNEFVSLLQLGVKNINKINVVTHLKAINITQSVLHMGINDQLGKTQNLTTKMESIPKS